MAQCTPRCSTTATSASPAAPLEFSTALREGCRGNISDVHHQSLGILQEASALHGEREGEKKKKDAFFLVLSFYFEVNRRLI